eukprot:COSAG03_NODE_9352_length_727_cov_0.710191_2_plen_41_part_01
MRDGGVAECLPVCSASGTLKHCPFTRAKTLPSLGTNRMMLY